MHLGTFYYSVFVHKQSPLSFSVAQDVIRICLIRFTQTLVERLFSLNKHTHIKSFCMWKLHLKLIKR